MLEKFASFVCRPGYYEDQQRPGTTTEFFSRLLGLCYLLLAIGYTLFSSALGLQRRRLPMELRHRRVNQFGKVPIAKLHGTRMGPGVEENVFVFGE